MKKKLLALVCALALTVSLVGCALSTPDTVGKIGDFEVTSGLYLLAQYDAYQQAAQLADSEQDTSKVNSFLKATITTDADTGETAVVKDYVAQKTLETLQTLAAVDARFTELGGQLTEEQKSAADSYAQQLMDNYAMLHCQRHRAGDFEDCSSSCNTSRPCCWIWSTARTARPLWRTAS